MSRLTSSMGQAPTETCLKRRRGPPDHPQSTRSTEAHVLGAPQAPTILGSGLLYDGREVVSEPFHCWKGFSFCCRRQLGGET